MTPEERQLLLRDLCAREPYHPRIQVFNQGYEGFQDGEFDTNLWLHHIDAFRFDRIEILPYLRPMSSMTEEEKDEFNSIFNGTFQYFNQGVISASRLWDRNEAVFVGELDCSKLIDWLNEHHFDYRGLIEKGLALEAPVDMYK